MVIGRKGANKKVKEETTNEDETVKAKKGKKKTPTTPAKTPKKTPTKAPATSEKAADPIRSPLFNISKPIPNSPTAGQSFLGFGIELPAYPTVTRVI